MPPMNKLAKFDRAATQADQAYEALLAEILDCRLAPGAKITISDVAVRLGFSPGAIREALSRLAAEKWTVATAQKGYSVTPVSVDELQGPDADAHHHRAALSARRHRAWRRRMGDRRRRRLSPAAPHSDGGRNGQHSRVSPAWAAAHTTFHAALVAGCDSPWMLTLRAMLYAQSERYRHLSFALGQANTRCRCRARSDPRCLPCAR